MMMDFSKDEKDDHHLAQAGRWKVMTVFKVNVKWGKQKFQGVELDTAAPLAVFKMQLFSLCMVPPEKQQLLLKGKTLTDDMDLTTVDKLKDGATMMLMGTAEAVSIEAPETPVVFMEDLSEDQRELKMSNLPGGIQNIGNTCYANATLQCFRAVPELMEALKRHRAPLTSVDPQNALVLSTQDLYSNLDEIGSSASPIRFNQMLRLVHPEFAGEGPQGAHKQQDAEEAWNVMLTAMKARVKMPDTNENAIDALFGLETEATLKCIEAPEEAPVVTTERIHKLTCPVTADISNLLKGLEESMSENIEKRSSTLDRDAQYERLTAIKKLPPYLTIHFLRFGMGIMTQGREATRHKVKKLKPVIFPKVMDVSSLCDTETQTLLRKRRARRAAAEDKAREAAEAKGARTPTARHPVRAPVPPVLPISSQH